MTKRELPSPELLRQLLDYDPETGVLSWRVGRLAGKPGFATKHKGYHCGKIEGRQLFAHRVAYCLHHGYWPETIDHANGDKTDNRIANLRNVSMAENNRNRPLSKRNISGVIGVSRYRGNRWKVAIRRPDGTRLVKYCLSLDDAMYIREAADLEFGYHANHGRPKDGSGAV